MSKNQIIPPIEQAIHTIRGEKVLLDEDLARFYGITTKRLNERVTRNPGRFPVDFVFQLTRAEYDALRSQDATLKRGRGQHRKYLPRVFTEHGAVALAGVIDSPRADEVSVWVVRAFVRMRQLLANHKELAAKLNDLDARVSKHDRTIRDIVAALRELMRGQVQIKAKLAKPALVEARRRIGFGRRREGGGSEQ